jgi:hypothetical protein
MKQHGRKSPVSRPGSCNANFSDAQLSQGYAGTTLPTRILAVEVIVRAAGRVVCLKNTRAVRRADGLQIPGFTIPAALLP